MSANSPHGYDARQLRLLQSLFRDWIKAALKQSSEELRAELEQARASDASARRDAQIYLQMINDLKNEIDGLDRKIVELKRPPKLPALPLNELKVPPRILFAFEQNGFRTVGDVADCSEREIARTRGLGKVGMAQLKAELDRLNLKFRIPE